MVWKETVKDVMRETELTLYQYPVWKMSIENQKIAANIPLYKERTSPAYTGYPSTTERMAIEKVTKEIKIQQIEKSLEILTEWERQYIEEKYFNPRHPSDYEVCEELGISRRTITRLKTPAILKVATALNIPKAEECLTEIMMKKWAIQGGHHDQTRENPSDLRTV
ncbi:ArpU family phage packaging/lysis transcriptional regulator [Thermoactinomyces sp. CICC 10521]|jgi:ArpU family phage transcriptional regulator|uniref:ArpU family phage packaging/lysis transcriptional regulator n=1 Tax=Thermoactinomyces sp. CICC 10521 TaxID=2767426 RepID=UPI0018DD0312|nr:ArpU family phage packaging/lysis transcriptional regulator [Thermoactinomyces sp. CICC 10521]MBH8609317.1 hypothetical protein [Thermoactinomyces sp. CICC 10521]